MRENIGKHLVFVLCLAFLAFSAGCGQSGPNSATISGTINLDGQPVELGSILFRPVEGTKGAVSGGKIEKGRYQLSDVAVGWNKVEISVMHETGRMALKPFGKPGEMVKQQSEAVHPRFNQQSTLKIDVKPGSNTKDFDVTSQ